MFLYLYWFGGSFVFGWAKLARRFGEISCLFFSAFILVLYGAEVVAFAGVYDMFFFESKIRFQFPSFHAAIAGHRWSTVEKTRLIER